MSEEAPTASSKSPETYEQNPWGSRESIVQEIKEKKQNVDYKKLLQGKKVLFLADNHSNFSIRLHIAKHARELREAGITHYAIEADEGGKDVFDRLNQGEEVDLSGVDIGPAESASGLSKLGEYARTAASGLTPSISFSESPYEGKKGDEYAIREIAKQGIKVVPIDIDQSTKPSKEEREAHLTQGVSRILETNTEAKVAVLIGGYHTLKRFEPEGVKSVGKRITEADYPTATIQFTGGMSEIPRMVTDGAREAGVDNQEFLLDMQPYSDISGSVPFGAGETDYAIHLPQEPGLSRNSLKLGIEPLRLTSLNKPRLSEAEREKVKKYFSDLESFIDQMSQRDKKS